MRNRRVYEGELRDELIAAFVDNNYSRPDEDTRREIGEKWGISLVNITKWYYRHEDDIKRNEEEPSEEEDNDENTDETNGLQPIM